jgi:UDP-glucose 4-epimerase
MHYLRVAQVTLLPTQALIDHQIDSVIHFAGLKAVGESITQVASGQRCHLNIFDHDYSTPDGTGARDYIHVGAGKPLIWAQAQVLVC